MIEFLRDFHFLRPFWLLLVIPFVTTFLALKNMSTLSGAWQKLIEPRLLSHLVVNRSASKWLRPVTLMLPFGIIGVVAMAGPTWELADSPLGPGESTLWVVVENGRTMSGVDVGPSRIERVKLKTHDLLKAKQTERTGLIAYAATAHVVMPPTTNSDVILPYLQALDPELMPEDGDRLDRVVDALERLGPTAVQGPTTVVVATDGSTPAAAGRLGEWAVANQVAVVLWSVGTREGVPGEAIPGVDAESLEAVARATQGEVVDLSLGSSDIRQILRTVSRHRRQSADPSDDRLWKDNGYFLVFPLLLWVLLWFRRGWVVRIGAVSMVFLLTGCGDATFADIWLTRDMQGRYHFDEGDYETAAQRFEDPMWRGLAAYANQDWEQAIQAFSSVQTAEGYYNLGNAYAQWKRELTAIQAYDKALELNPGFTQARQNRDMLQKDLDAMIVSDDAEESMKAPKADKGEHAIELKEEQKSQREQPKNPFDAVDDQENAALKQISSQRDEAWMRRVTTNPKDFLRTKFAADPQGAP